MMPIKSNQNHKHNNNFQNCKYIIKLKMTLTLYRRTWIVHLNSTRNNISIIMDINLNTLWELVMDRKSWHTASLWGRKESDTTEWLEKKKTCKDNCLWDFIVFYIEKNILVKNFWVFIDQALWSIISFKPQINPIWQVFCHMVGNIFMPHL